MRTSYLCRLYYHSLHYSDFLEAVAGTAPVRPYVPFVEALNMVGLVTSLHCEKKQEKKQGGNSIDNYSYGRGVL